MKIAYGNSRMEKKWKNRDVSWESFCKRVSSPAAQRKPWKSIRKWAKSSKMISRMWADSSEVI